MNIEGNTESYLTVRKLEDQLYEVQKQCRGKESLLRKEKAVLEQRVNLLELQIQEAKEREENTKKMYEAMMQALRPLNEEAPVNIPKELEITTELHKKELQTIRQEHAETKLRLEKEISALQIQRSSHDSEIQEIQLQKNELCSELENLKQEYNKLKKEYTLCTTKLQEETMKCKENLELDFQLKISNVNSELEKQKADHQREIERIKEQSEAALRDIKYIHTQEKNILEERVSKYHSELTAKQGEEPSNLLDPKTTCIEEIRELNAHLDAFKRQSKEEIAQIKKQRDEAIKRAETVEEEMQGMKHTMRNSQNIHDQSMKNFRSKLEKAQQLIDNNDKAHSELYKTKKQITELRNTITKLESSEKRLKTVILQKEKERDEEIHSFKSKINAERRKALQAHEDYAKVKEEYETKKALILKDMVSKDEIISSLSKQLEQVHKEQLEDLSKIGGISNVMEKKDSRKPNENSITGAISIEGYHIDKIRRKDLQHLQDCKNILNHSSSVVCKKCNKIISLEVILEHIVACPKCTANDIEDSPCRSSI